MPRETPSPRDVLPVAMLLRVAALLGAAPFLASGAALAVIAREASATLTTIADAIEGDAGSLDRD